MPDRDWEERYRTGDLPWDTGQVDHNLLRAVETPEYGLNPCRVLEIGCGTGTNALWLARRGFQVTGVDLSPTAITKARAKVAEAGVEVDLHVGDFVNERLVEGPFDLAFDRGCFHVFDYHHRRVAFAEQVWRLLAPSGRWLSLLGSADQGPRDTGPPQRSALDIASAVEHRFEVLCLEAVDFLTSRAWLALLRRRA